MPPLSAPTLSTPIHVAPFAVSFADYQALHQEQQRRRYPAQQQPKPATAASWQVKVQRLAPVVAAAVAAGYWLWPRYWLWLRLLVSCVLLATVSTVLGRVYQWWNYRQAYRQLPDQPQATSFAAEAQGITVIQNGRSRFFRWVDFYSIQHVQSWLLLYTSVEHCYYLSLGQIRPPATAADLLALLPAAVSSPE